MWKEKATATKTRLTDAGWWSVVARGGAEGTEVDEGSQKAAASSYKAVKWWECNIQHGDCS